MTQTAPPSARKVNANPPSGCRSGARSSGMFVTAGTPGSVSVRVVASGRPASLNANAALA